MNPELSELRDKIASLEDRVEKIEDKMERHFAVAIDSINQSTEIVKQTLDLIKGNY